MRERAGRDEQDRPADDERWRTAGDRIETLLEASSVHGGPAARQRAEQLVREVVDLYGAALSRLVGCLGADAAAELVRDDLVASLLLVHGLHPHDVQTRVRAALDGVRPYLGSHGGDVSLLEVRDSVVRLRLSGSCRTCPSSSVTLELAVEDAVRAAAPEIDTIEVDTAAETSAVIAAESLFSHVDRTVPATGSWVPVPAFADLRPGEVGGFAVAGLDVVVCRIGAELYAYRDHCPACEQSLAGAVLHGGPDSPAGDAVLQCPCCRAHYDAVHAGDRLDGDGHLDPLPMLVRDGQLSVAVPVEVAG
ncbi:NifU family protein [Nocardia sp. alder85J]|nr:NifU family protein [Nocardia sp. alder85J]MCX4098105.1 NifU family protein [Nocardia sp. alder85J]